MEGGGGGGWIINGMALLVVSCHNGRVLLRPTTVNCLGYLGFFLLFRPALDLVDMA